MIFMPALYIFKSLPSLHNPQYLGHNCLASSLLEQIWTNADIREQLVNASSSQGLRVLVAIRLYNN